MVKRHPCPEQQPLLVAKGILLENLELLLFVFAMFVRTML